MRVFFVLFRIPLKWEETETKSKRERERYKENGIRKKEKRERKKRQLHALNFHKLFTHCSAFPLFIFFEFVCVRAIWLLPIEYSSNGMAYKTNKNIKFTGRQFLLQKKKKCGKVKNERSDRQIVDGTKVRKSNNRKYKKTTTDANMHK